MIKFITEEQENKNPTFEDVDVNQFFVDWSGDLCQKIDGGTYVIIATKDGEPWACMESNFPESKKIKRILPHVAKIEF